MRKQIWAWECELCGHTWIAVGVDAPVQCARCKRRNWHTKQPEVVQPGEHSAPVRSKHSMADLRAICVGRIPNASEPVAQVELVMCSYTEYDTDTGEVYGCRLPAHGPKVKHQRGPAR